MALDDSDEEKAPIILQNAPSPQTQASTSDQEASLPAAPYQQAQPRPKVMSTSPMDTMPVYPQRVSLETFDMSTFDPTNPASWAGLAQAFHISTGREPNQLELMQYLATGGSAGNLGGGGSNMDMRSGGAGDDDGGFDGGEYRGRGGYRGRGRGRGRGIA